jgi:DNA-binding response OmpR family regulator
MATTLQRPTPLRTQLTAQALVVGDDAGLVEFLDEQLSADRFAVARAPGLDAALAALGEVAPDVVVVEDGGGGSSGLELVSAVRHGGGADGWDPGVPILVIAGRSDPYAVVRALERGADDCLTQPFHYPELLARVHALLRRSRGEPHARALRVGGLEIDRRARRATFGGRGLELSAKELSLLVALARDPARVVTKQELLREVWGYASPGRTRTVDSHASRLRRKLAAGSGGERWIENVWGLGYRLRPVEGAG